jgi:hypothetical protein
MAPAKKNRAAETMRDAEHSDLMTVPLEKICSIRGVGIGSRAEAAPPNTTGAIVMPKGEHNRQHLDLQVPYICSDFTWLWRLLNAR